MQEEKKEIKIKLSTVLIVISLFLTIIVIMGVTIYKLMNDKRMSDNISEAQYKIENLDVNNTIEPNDEVIIDEKENKTVIEENIVVEEPEIKKEIVKSGDIIKPSKIINKIFDNDEELMKFAYSSWEENIEMDDALKFYSNEFATGDAIWSGLVTNYSASSTYKPNEDKYNVDNLKNLLTDNCWCEGVNGNGIGETIEITAYDSCEKVDLSSDDSESGEDVPSIEDVTDYLLNKHNSELERTPNKVKITKDTLNNYYHNLISQIAIINGYAKSGDLWKNNNRVKKLKVTIDNKVEFFLELDDTKNLQLFDIYYENETITKEMDLKFEIIEVYKGDRDDDTCLTSLYLMGGSNVYWGGR